ncbi:MAG TPA: hypothetical protein VLT36_17575 [Candidatus Dormibacteraeota bacterium]|nr:hypothetical protein [Candidatus Dormibacteraeota bacterium]
MKKQSNFRFNEMAILGATRLVCRRPDFSRPFGPCSRSRSAPRLEGLGCCPTTSLRNRTKATLLERLRIVLGGARLRGLAAASLLCAAAAANGQTIHLNFDSVNAGGGTDATTYLAAYGITLTNVSNPGSVYIVSDTNFYGSAAVTASSRHNFLLQQVGGSPPGVSYTMKFSAPMQTVSFTRCAVTAGTATPIWTAAAYAGSTQMDSVGVCCIDSDTGQGATPTR